MKRGHQAMLPEAEADLLPEGDRETSLEAAEPSTEVSPCS